MNLITKSLQFGLNTICIFRLNQYYIIIKVYNDEDSTILKQTLKNVDTNTYSIRILKEKKMTVTTVNDRSVTIKSFGQLNQLLTL